MIALASVRSHHRLWALIFKDVGSGGTPTARFFMSAAGWMLVAIPFTLLFLMAYIRLYPLASLITLLVTYAAPQRY